jgi:hypothetical protein
MQKDLDNKRNEVQSTAAAADILSQFPWFFGQLQQQFQSPIASSLNDTLNAMKLMQRDSAVMANIANQLYRKHLEMSNAVNMEIVRMQRIIDHVFKLEQEFQQKVGEKRKR